jgi:glucokinase
MARLPADVGGIHTRFAWQGTRRCLDRVCPDAAMFRPLHLVDAPLLPRLARGTPRSCSIAVAKPAVDDRMTMTKGGKAWT